LAISAFKTDKKSPSSPEEHAERDSPTTASKTDKESPPSLEEHAERGSPTTANHAATAATKEKKSPVQSDSVDRISVARKAHDILKASCYRCHGENGTAEGGFNFVLDRDKLVARRKLLPGDAEHSKLYRRVSEGEMPPEGETPRPTPAEIANLKEWIDEGAPAGVQVTRPSSFITEAQVVALIHADVVSRPERDRRFLRYFTITHLANAGFSSDELLTYQHALAKLVNSLSWRNRIVVPEPINLDATILRVDIRDYQWTERVWDNILASYPYGVLQGIPEAKACFDIAGGQLSHVRLDWFVAVACSPPLYHQVLQLPEEDRRLEEQLHIDVVENIRQERVVRAAFNGSGVSRNNRLIERHESPHGSYWRSYDFADNLGRHNIFAHPLGPGQDANSFEYNGSEIIFNLPNGLHAFMLVDARGKRLNKAPPDIVSDPRRPDRAVENGISCMTCHARGLIPKSDQVRNHLRENSGAFSQVEADAISALYPAENKLRSLFAADNERFRKAIGQTGSRLGTTEPIAALVVQHEHELDLRLAAAEVGMKPKEFSEHLDQSAPLARTLGSLRIAGGTVQRQVYASAFQDLVTELKLGTYLPPRGRPIP
jgi:hypothetical protein